MSNSALSPDAQMRQSLRLLRESLQATPAPRATLLREDIQNMDNTGAQELQRAMGSAIGAALVISSVQETGGVSTVIGLLRLGQDVHFTFTSQQPDGCFINCQQLELSESTAQILSKLQAYHATWYTQTATGEKAAPADSSPLETTPSTDQPV